MVDVFVSYASQDRELVGPIVDALADVGWTVWWDREIGAGTAFDREIEKALDSARCVVVLWTEHSVESEWVRTEANEGLEKGILVPVQLAPVRPPLAFRRIQMTDLSQGNFEELTASIAKLTPIPLRTESDSTPFVGRDKEFATIESRLAGIERSEGSFLLVSGDAGVGKTRLADEIAAEAAKRGCIVLTGHSLDMEGAPPYQPLIEQIEQVRRNVDDAVMREILGDNAPEVSKLMPELRQTYPDIPEPASMPPEQERRYLLNGITEFIDRSARTQPIVLIFEDVHWADSSTCMLLRYFADRLTTSPVLILATYRESALETNRPFSRTLQELNRERLVDELPLGLFPKEQVHKFLQNKAKQSPPDALVELVYSETEGNPFFMEELYRHLLEEGKMFNEDGQFAPGIQIADTEVPRGVRLIIGERLDKVSEACRTTLTLGAVIGRRFNFEVLLSASTKLDEDDLLDALDEAMAERLVTDYSRDREAIYGFTQEQVRQTLLSALSFPRRQRMHLKIADALEAYAGQKSDRFVAEVAHHLYQAGAAADEMRTVEYLMRAAERTMAALAYEDALGLYDSALAIIEDTDPDRVGLIQIRRAEALQGMEQFDEALDTLKQTVAKLSPGETLDSVILKRCRILLDLWRGSETIDDLEALLVRRQTAGDKEQELDARVWLSRAHYILSLDKPGHAEKAIDSYEETISLARELNRPRELCQALIAASQLIDYSPEYFDIAYAHLNEARDIADALDSEELQIEVLTMRLNFFKDDRQMEKGEEVLARLKTRRDPVRLNAHYFRMMWLSYSEMQTHRCVEICDEGIDLAYRIGTLPVQYPSIKGMAFLDLGNFEAAWQAISDEISDEDHRFGAALQQLGYLQYELDVGDFDAALQRATHVVAESHALSRIWMLRWIVNAMAGITAFEITHDRRDSISEVIESAGMPPDAFGRASLALAKHEPNIALDTLEQKDETWFTNRGPKARVEAMVLTCQALQQQGNWADLKSSAENTLHFIRPFESMPLIWRTLLSLSAAEDALGNKQASMAALGEAEQIWQKTADSIPDSHHKQTYATLAESLGL